MKFSIFITTKNRKNDLVLVPFAGSGTTPLELQLLGINCYSFEVSPFMHLLATVKLETDYNSYDFNIFLSIYEFVCNIPKKQI